MPAAREQVPVALQHLQLTPQPGTKLKNLFVYDHTVAIVAAGSLEEDTQLFPLDGVAQGDGFVATRVAVGVLYKPLFGESYWTPAAECHGKLAIDPRGATLELDGPHPCETARGVFRPRQSGPAVSTGRVVAAMGPCVRYRDCTCGLAALARGRSAGARLATMSDAFAKNCQEAESLLRTVEPDAEACTLGLTMARELGRELGGAGAQPAICR